MSRSYRKPYCTWTRIGSAHWAKTLASRYARRLFNNSLQNCDDFENYLDPDRREARFNDVYCWPQDGKKRLHIDFRKPGRLPFWETQEWTMAKPERIERAKLAHEKWLRKISQK